MNKDRVAAIVIWGGKVLLMFRRNKGKEYFTFPGGGIEFGETREQALIRELREETSIEIIPGNLVYDVEWDGTTHQYFFQSSYVKGNPALGDFVEKEVMRKNPDQFYEPRWVDMRSLPRLLVYPLEVKDQFLEDLSQQWPGETRSLRLQIATCRQTLGHFNKTGD